ncbi:ribonuclease H-like domain-containing protein [Tanacetum coccineum]
MVTRFHVGSNRPSERPNLHVSTISHLPTSYAEAFNNPNWQNAIRYKARLVVNDSTQLSSIDVDENFSLVVIPATIRTVLGLATSRHYLVHQLDIKNAFLHGDLSKIVYMHQPQGFQDFAHPGYIIGLLHYEFSMKDLGSLNYFLGISIMRDSLGMFLSQRKYAIEILERAHMVGCNPIWTPVDTESKLGADGDQVSDPRFFYNPGVRLDIASQLFPRPTILLDSPESRQAKPLPLGASFIYMHDPWEPHFSALKRILSVEAEYRGVANVVAATC